MTTRILWRSYRSRLHYFTPQGTSALPVSTDTRFLGTKAVLRGSHYSSEAGTMALRDKSLMLKDPSGVLPTCKPTPRRTWSLVPGYSPRNTVCEFLSAFGRVHPPLHFLSTLMAPTRAASQPVSANIQRKKELRVRERGQIQGSYAGGCQICQIAARTRRASATIATTLQKASIYTSQETLPRSGRLNIYNDRDERYICIYIRRHPLATYSEIREGCGVTFCNATILRILWKRNLGHWRQCERPLLT